MSNVRKRAGQETACALETSVQQEALEKSFLLAFPTSLLLFWDFCSSISTQSPLDVFLQTTGLSLTGPFEALHGIAVKNPLTRWKYFYDLPELVTVAYTKRVSESFPKGFHLCYYRDEPHQAPQGVVANIPDKSCEFEFFGDEMFAAMKTCLEKIIENDSRPTVAVKSRNMIQRMNEFASAHSIDLRRPLGQCWNTRKKAVVARDESGLGIVVPYDSKTSQGYRPLRFDRKQLKAVLEEYRTSPKDSRDTSKLQELVTWASVAVDEGDIGTGLHLGRSLFLADVPTADKLIFMKTGKAFLRTAYTLLNRTEFCEVLEKHSKIRTLEPQVAGDGILQKPCKRQRPNEKTT